MEITAERKEKYILVGVDTGDGRIGDSLDELAELLRTAGGEEAARVVQARPTAHPGTYIGSGKVEELKELLEETGADGIIADDELGPAAMRNLEDALDTKVLDRTALILDIFAGRATTREGKLQVELAQLKYRMTRLTGKGTALSRLGGGIGTRGPGETKLETDRRRIRIREANLRAEVEDLARHRKVSRQSRERNRVPVVAIVGYTNAGKSTLLNALTGSDVLSENKLFATLDPTTRRATLPGGSTVLFTDTVGFIHKLPHHLIDAFRSTLEEAKYADVIAHVMDVSDPNYTLHRDVVEKTLAELGVEGKPVIAVHNKWDLVEEEIREGTRAMIPKDPKARFTVRTSAKKGEGLRELLAAVEEILRENKVYLEAVLPFGAAGLVKEIRDLGELLEESYTEEGIRVRAYAPAELAMKANERAIHP